MTNHPTLTRRALLSTGLATGMIAPALSASSGPAVAHSVHETILLWPDGAPGMPATPPTEVAEQRSKDRQVQQRSLSGVSRPRLLRVAPSSGNGTSVVILPGGGYRTLSVDSEGLEVARFLAERGYDAYVLLYRLPGEGWANRAAAPLADAQRAVRLLRQRGAEKVAAIGFSAGGHLCASLGTHFARKVYDPVDAADRLSARPDGAAPIYPVITMTGAPTHGGSRRNLLGKSASETEWERHSIERQVSEDAPPFFLAHAEDDRAVPPENSLLLRAALKAQKVPVETHLFGRGGHGFGTALDTRLPAGNWLHVWHHWARNNGLG